MMKIKIGNQPIVKIIHTKKKYSASSHHLSHKYLFNLMREKKILSRFRGDMMTISFESTQNNAF